MARDAIALYLDADPASIEVDVSVRLLAKLESPVAEATRARAEADRLQAESSKLMRAAVADLLADGLSIREVAMILGVSHQRVSQLADSPRLARGS